MKNLVLVVLGGILGCGLSLGLLQLSIIQKPPENRNLAKPEPSRDHEAPPNTGEASKDVEFLPAELKSLRSSLASLEMKLNEVSGEIRAFKEVPKQPDGTVRDLPAYLPATPEADAAWLRLMLREFRPKAYADAIEIVEKKFVPRLKKYYLDRKTCVGAELEALMPSNLGENVWRWNDFEFTVKNLNEAEIVLVADPESPKLSAIITFGENVKTADDRMEMVGWNKLPHWERSVPPKKSEARESEARRRLGALKDVVRLYHSTNNKLPQSVDDVKDNPFAKVDGEYFRKHDYAFGGTEEAFTVTCRNVFNDEPYDLVLTVNLKTGESKFNR